MTPVFMCQWMLYVVARNSLKIKDDYQWTDVRCWFELEANLLIAQIYFGMLFVFLYSLLKLDSFWPNMGLNHDLRKIKKAYMEKSDFLGTMKFEFSQFTFAGSMLIGTLYQFPILSPSPTYKNFTHHQMEPSENCVLWLFVIVHVC